MQALKQIVTCRCGNVKVAIDSPDVLRLVCYCKDCRGYYQTLNRTAESEKKTPSAPLDAWGGVDWTQCYPNEITVLQGKEQLATRVLHPKSSMYRVYTTCCFTPMFSLGQAMGSALLNSHLIEDPNTMPDVRYRIIGRQALDGGEKNQRPKMSWSLPLSWCWVMFKRINKKRMNPSPIDLDKKPDVLEGFKEG